MRANALVYLAVEPLLVTALIAFFVPSAYAKVAYSMMTSAFVFTVLCLLPVSVYIATLHNGDVRLASGWRQPGTAIAGIALLDFIVYSAVRAETGVLVSLVGSTAIYLTYFYYLVRRAGTAGLLGPRCSQKLLFALVVYLGLVPWTFPTIHGLSTTVSVYYAAILTFIFATAMASTDSVVGAMSTP